MEIEGPVCRSDWNMNSKGLFNKSTSDDLYSERFKHPRSIAIHKPDDRFKNSYWGTKGLIALGATSEVVVCSMKPI